MFRECLCEGGVSQTKTLVLPRTRVGRGRFEIYEIHELLRDAAEMKRAALVDALLRVSGRLDRWKMRFLDVN